MEWCVIVLSGALAISCGLWWLSPHVSWYVGASGVLHTVMAGGNGASISPREPGTAGYCSWCLSAKLAWEQLGRTPGAPGGRRRSSVWGGLRICGRRRAVVADRYNSPAVSIRIEEHMSLAFVFPGQGSQSVGMMSALAQVSPVIEPRLLRRPARCWATISGSAARKGRRRCSMPPNAPSRRC